MPFEPVVPVPVSWLPFGLVSVKVTAALLTGEPADVTVVVMVTVLPAE